MNAYSVVFSLSLPLLLYIFLQIFLCDFVVVKDRKEEMKKKPKKCRKNYLQKIRRQKKTT